MVSLKKQQLGIKRQKWFLRSSKEARRASRDKDFGRESGHKSTCGGICNRPDLQDCSSHLHFLIIVLQFFHSIITKKPVLVLKASQNMTITMIMMVMITMMIDGDDDDYDDNGDDENDDGDINFLPTELVCAATTQAPVSLPPPAPPGGSS